MTALARILAEDVLTFAYCDENEIDEDFAVTQLERISYCLRQATKDEIQAFISAVKALEKEAKAQGNKERATQFKTMVSHLGLSK
jgi:hypothetical protein